MASNFFDSNDYAFVDSDGQVVFAKGNTVPTGSGYLTGCVFLHVDGGVGTALYINDGGSASADFTAVNGAPAERARTATTDGSGTGTIAAGSKFVTITSDRTTVNDIIVLPTPVVGSEIWLTGTNTGYELRSNAPTTVAINEG